MHFRNSSCEFLLLQQGLLAAPYRSQLAGSDPLGHAVLPIPVFVYPSGHIGQFIVPATSLYRISRQGEHTALIPPNESCPAKHWLQVAAPGLIP